MTVDRDKLRRLLSPTSIAFIGGNIAGMTISRSEDIGFEGEIWAVNPHAERLGGHRCINSIDHLPQAPDAVFVGVNRELTIDTVRQLADMGAGGCVCYAAGFAEIGGAGVALQQQLVEAAGDMPLVGPNCFGFINLVDRCALWPYLFGSKPCDSGVAFISQSGNIAMNLTMNDRSVNFTHVIGTGNQANLGPADYVDALLEDERVRAIGMYVEGFDDVHAFALAAQRAKEKKIPIVVMKIGRTEASAKQANSHTSSLTGSDILYDVFFDRLSLVRVNSLNRLLETLKILHMAGPLTGRDIVTLSCSGGEAATIADLAPEFDLATPQFSAIQTEKLTAQFPVFVTVSNPFDYNTSIWGRYDKLEQCFHTSLNGNHDAAFLIYDHPIVDSVETEEWIAALDAFSVAHKKTGTPAFVVCTVTELLPEPVRTRALEAGVVPLQGLEDGLYAYAAAAGYYSADCTVPRRAGDNNLSTPHILDEAASKAILADAGLVIPRGEIATVDEAGATAERIGFPVVVKAIGNEFAHKSDMGAIRLNLGSASEVDSAVQSIVESCAKHGRLVERLLVEEMQANAVGEVIVGIKRDVQFGPALVVGSGGILVELMRDSVSLLLPTDRKTVVEAIQKLAVSKLIDGFRGQPGGDREALINAVLIIAGIAENLWDTVLELDVNPLLVMESGVVAVDALLVLATESP